MGKSDRPLLQAVLNERDYRIAYGAFRLRQLASRRFLYRYYELPTGKASQLGLASLEICARSVFLGLVFTHGRAGIW